VRSPAIAIQPPLDHRSRCLCTTAFTHHWPRLRNAIVFRSPTTELRGLADRPNFLSLRERELDEELRFHLEARIQQEIAGGRTPEEARYVALRAMDGMEQSKGSVAKCAT
jgi:hypothetical protein